VTLGRAQLRQLATTVLLGSNRYICGLGPAITDSAADHFMTSWITNVLDHMTTSP